MTLGEVVCAGCHGVARSSDPKYAALTVRSLLALHKTRLMQEKWTPPASMRYALQSIGSYAVVLNMRETHRWWEPHSRHGELPLTARRNPPRELHRFLRLPRDLHVVIMGFLNPHYYAPVIVMVKTLVCTLLLKIYPNASIADVKDLVFAEYMRNWQAYDERKVGAAPGLWDHPNYRLMYGGAVLQPERLVSSYFIRNGSTLQVLDYPHSMLNTGVLAS